MPPNMVLAMFAGTLVFSLTPFSMRNDEAGLGVFSYIAIDEGFLIGL